MNWVRGIARFTGFISFFALNAAAIAAPISFCTLALKEVAENQFEAVLDREYRNKLTGAIVAHPILRFERISGDKIVGAEIFGEVDGETVRLAGAGAYQSGDALTVSTIEVEKAYRRQGIQEDLFQFLVSRSGTVKSIGGELTEVNGDIVSQVLIDHALKRADAVTTRIDRNKHPTEFLNACCGSFIQDLKTHPEKFEGLAENAVLGTPAYKTRRRLGFSRICEKPRFTFFRVNGITLVNLHLITCRD